MRKKENVANSMTASSLDKGNPGKPAETVGNPSEILKKLEDPRKP